MGVSFVSHTLRVLYLHQGGGAQGLVVPREVGPGFSCAQGGGARV